MEKENNKRSTLEKEKEKNRYREIEIERSCNSFVKRDREEVSLQFYCKILRMVEGVTLLNIIKEVYKNV